MASHALPAGEYVTNSAHEIVIGSDVSQDDAGVITSALAAENKRLANHQRRTVRKFEDSITRHLADRDAVAGARTLRRLRTFAAKQRSSVYGLTDFRPGHFDYRQLQAAKESARVEGDRIVARAKIDPGALGKVNDKTFTRNLGIARGALKRKHRIEVAPVENAVEALHGSTDSFMKSAPFDASSFWYSYRRWGGNLDFSSKNEILHNPFKHVTGKLGHESAYRNSSASEFDALFFTMKTSVGFKYTHPAQGFGQIWVKIHVDTSRADVWLEDEYGGSTGSNNFVTRFELNVAQLPGVEGATDWWVTTADGEPDEGTWYYKTLIADGADIWLPFAVDFPPDPVFIWITAHDNRSTLLNDVSCDSRMITHYEVKEVHIG